MATAESARGKSNDRWRAFRFIFSGVLMVLCVLGATTAWRTGWARFLAASTNQSLLAQSADRAVQLSASDAETHSSRAVVLYQAGDIHNALKELESAAIQRPQDYLLWLQIGRARDEAGDGPAALAAFQEAIRLAPFYSDPRWQYGNVLYRVGRFAEAFHELSIAADSDPTLTPVLMDLAWNTYGGDAKAVERIVAPRNDATRISLARFFVKKGRVSDALKLFQATGPGEIDEKRRLLTDLLIAKQFRAAYEVWAAGVPKRAARGSINNPGFEDAIDLNARGFSWRQEHERPGVTLSLDTKRPRSGSSCLLIDWKGHATPEVPVLTQLVPVESHSHYRLNFFVRTEDVVTGALPVIAVVDAGGDERTLVQSKPFPEGASDWQEYQVEFETPPDAQAVMITLQRQACSSNPCPIFGRVWLDDFAMRKE
jgi:tetratricopeptide (TPR) repeat protein